MNFLYTSIELVIGFAALFIVTKFIGKRQLSQITPFDFISAIVLGELLGNAIYDREIGVLYIIGTLVLWAILMLITELLTQKFLRLRGFLEGNPSILIRNGIIDRKELKKNKLDINELQSMLRQRDVFSVREVEYAILEPNGKLSVLKKPKYDVPTAQDLNMPDKLAYLPVTLIIDGEVLPDNLKTLGFNKKWLQKQIQQYGICNVKDVFYAEWKGDEGIHVVPLNKKKS